MPEKKKYYRREDGRVKATVTTGVRPDGRPIRKCVYARSDRELQRKVEEIKLAMRTGTFADPGRMTMAQYLELWRDKHVAKLRPKSREFYSFMIEYIIPILGAVKAKDLGPLHVEGLLDYYSEQELSGTTLHHIYCTLRAAWNKGIRWRLLPGDNPCKGVEVPSRTTERSKPFSRHEIHQLLGAAKGTQLYCFCLLAVVTGMREGELLGLKWSDLSFDDGWLRVNRTLQSSRKGKPTFGDPKTVQSERDIPLSPLLLQVLREHKSVQQVVYRLEAGAKWRDYDLVFTQRNGGPLNPSNLRHRHWYPMLQRAGLRRIKIHDLRHTAATVMLTDLGYDIKTVQEILGHTEARTTMDIYGHGRDDKKKEAVRRMDAFVTASANL